MSLDYLVSGEVGSRKFHLSYETVADGDSRKILLHILYFFFIITILLGIMQFYK